MVFINEEQRLSSACFSLLLLISVKTCCTDPVPECAEVLLNIKLLQKQRLLVFIDL